MVFLYILVLRFVVSVCGGGGGHVSTKTLTGGEIEGILSCNETSRVSLE